jgi:hypothetical protein
MNKLNQVLQGVLFLVLAIFGIAMAFVLMVSTALAIGVLYIVARIKGRPFGVKAYWDRRRQASARKSASGSGSFRNRDVSDIEMREIP